MGQGLLLFGRCIVGRPCISALKAILVSNYRPLIYPLKPSTRLKPAEFGTAKSACLRNMLAENRYWISQKLRKIHIQQVGVVFPTEFSKEIPNILCGNHKNNDTPLH